tara:strand:- start:366 stop:629 length:264 start_codon:yes stop_codon:yes gene_type:complete
MKLNLYISKLIRSIICKVGRQEASKLLGLSRTSIYLREYNKFKDDNQIKTLEPIAKEYCKLHPKEDLKEVLMQGLHFYLEDCLKHKV